jgi:hypothetical protein
MQEYGTHDPSDGICDAEESRTNFVSAGWAFCLIGIALLLILRTI